MHKAKLTISKPSYGDDKRKISIQVKDVDARIRFLKIEIDYDKFTECLTGLADIDCEMEFRGLQNVGKKIETKQLEFKIGDVDYCEMKKVAHKTAKSIVSDEWSCSDYYGSKDSFFMKDGKQWARTTASKWVEKEKPCKEK